MHRAPEPFTIPRSRRTHAARWAAAILIPLAAAAPQVCTATPAADRPNVVIVFIDDLGYGDIGPFGATRQKTPNLDRMAAEGMKLTSFYAAPVCSVSRAQLLTGCYGVRVGVPGVYLPAAPRGLNPAEWTIAERLRPLGYATACIGKWHLGDQPEFLPTRQGFDRYFGIPYSNDMQRVSAKTDEPVVPLVRDEHVEELLTDDAQPGIVARLTDEAVRFIEESRDRPFFLYLPHTAVHVPLMPGKTFRGTSENGPFGDWVAEVDWSVGRILQTLRDLKIAKQTLVIFTSDNGPWSGVVGAATSAGPLRGSKGSTWEGGVRVPTLAWWPGRIAAGSSCDVVAGTIDLLPTIVALAGGEVPREPVIDGRDIGPLLLGRSRTSPREAHYYFAGDELQAVRRGPWKLAVAPQKSGMGGKRDPITEPASFERPRLYNLDEDIGERTDVAAAHPETVAALASLATAMAAELGDRRSPARRPAGMVDLPRMLYETTASDKPRRKTQRPTARRPKTTATPRKHPNIVVILCDDMGFSDLGCYGSEIPTPSLDALAARGLRFSQFYNTGRCCPTRASLLTGRYAHSVGVGHMMEDDGLPGYRGRLADECVTIAEALRPAGYFTAMAGKWHVGQHRGVTPRRRGFDRSLNAAAGGFYQAGSKRFDLWLDGEPIADDDPRLGAGRITTDIWTDFALRCIDEAADADRPFFLYLAHNAPHFPLQAPADEIATFDGMYLDGWDAAWAARIRRQRDLGIFDSSWESPGRPADVAAWDGQPPEERERLARLMAVYAAVVHALDRAVGDLTRGLEVRGLLDDTLILFMSDNGGSPESGPAGRTEGDPSQPQSQWFCGAGWAWVENAPFRKGKASCHEGGIATPMIVHWPGGIAGGGEWRHQPGHVIDILPTCLDAAGVVMPRDRDGLEIPPPDGRSLLPAFAGGSIDRGPLFWEHQGNAAVRRGDLKLVRAGVKGPWELYDLAADRTEQRDLAETRPDVVRELATAWEAWAERMHVEPRPVTASRKGALRAPPSTAP